MICSHCKKVLDSENLMFCVYCGYPLKGEKKGFFAKSKETGVSRAEEMANTSSMEMPSLDVPPVPTAPAKGMPLVQNAQTVSRPGTVQQTPMQPMTAPMGMQQPMQGMPAGIAPMGMQGGMSPMGMQQPMQGMPTGIAPMGTQPMQGMADMNSMPQMGYGMPQMGYNMPQMGYNMPQFAGYDAAGNPMYVQMVPQFMGYDAYGNPIYNMVAMPCMMPGMQNMNGVSSMMQQMYPKQEQVIDIPQEQIRAADPSPAMPVQQQAAPVPGRQPVQQKIRPMQQPAVRQQAPVKPIQSIQEATLAVQEALNAYQTAKPVPPSSYRSSHISAADGMPLDAATLIQEDEHAPHVPDEKALLDSIFDGKSKNYSMSEGTKPASAVFSINISANEITNVPADEFGDASEPPPPPVSLFAKPGVQIMPFSEPAIRQTEPEPEAAAPSAPAPKPPVKKAKPRTEEDANAAKRAAKEQKLAKEAKEAKEQKAEKNARKKQPPQKKEPARIVSPEDFFDEPKKRRSNGYTMLSVGVDDDQVTEMLSGVSGKNGGKKSARSMKAAGKEEMDVSNVDADSLLSGVSNTRLPN